MFLFANNIIGPIVPYCLVKSSYATADTNLGVSPASGLRWSSHTYTSAIVHYRACSYRIAMFSGKLWPLTVLSVSIAYMCVCICFAVSDSWDDFLQTYMTHWVERIQHWVLEQTSDHPVMVVRYEDLKRSTGREVRRVFSFLQLPFSIKDLTQRLKEDFTTFKRPHCETCDFERYTASQTLHMKSSLEHAIHLAEQSNMSHILKLDEYLKDLP